MSNAAPIDATNGNDPAGSDDDGDAAKLQQAFQAALGKFFLQMMQPQLNDTLSAISEDY